MGLALGGKSCRGQLSSNVHRIRAGRDPEAIGRAIHTLWRYFERESRRPPPCLQRLHAYTGVHEQKFDPVIGRRSDGHLSIKGVLTGYFSFQSRAGPKYML